MRLHAALSIFMAASVVPLAAQSAEPYKPAQAVTGTVRVWGHGNRNEDYFGKLIPELNAAFRKAQPGAQVTSGMLGNASAVGGVYTGAADVALLDRSISFLELDGFQQATGHDPTEIAIATGSLKTRQHAPAAVIFVNRANPLASLSLTQLDAIFDADHRRGSASATTWGDLGLTGEWAARPIHPYGYTIARKQAQAFERSVMKGSQKWVCTLKEFDYGRDDPGGTRANRALQTAIAKDPNAIGFATLETDTPGIRPVALSDAGAAVMPTQAALAAGTYPLASTVEVVVDRTPGKPLDAKTAEFVSFLLSREGQSILASAGGLTPLTAEAAAQQRRKLQ